MLDNSPSKMEDREGRRLDQMADEIREAINHFIAFCIVEVFPKQSGPRSLVVVAAVSVFRRNLRG